jgi:hypothetical protein
MATDYDAPRKSSEDEDVDSLEEVKAATSARAAKTPDVDEDENAAAESFELPGADLSGEVLEVEVIPIQRGEFTCSSCFLVHHRAALADPERMLCRDCAA